jgi:hypothetical protein
MATGPVDLTRESPEHIESTVSSIKMMLKVGAVFAAVGSLLTGSALVFELTQLHPLLDECFATYTQTSLAGGGPERAGAVNGALASIHKWASTLLWLKLGGIAHILVGIFVALGAIARALALISHRLSHEMERTQG